MGEQLYSAEEAAQILGLQVRTVRNYVREGRLPGVRIGKQYRIARTDLEAFTGGSGLVSTFGEPPDAVSKIDQTLQATTVEVSSVVHVDAIDPASADRIARTLAAAAAGRGDSGPPLHVEPLYDENRGRLRVVIVGEVDVTVELLRVLQALVT